MATAAQVPRAPDPASGQASPRRGIPSSLGLKGWIVKITGVLVVLPALLNAGYDVYAAAAKVP